MGFIALFYSFKNGKNRENKGKNHRYNLYISIERFLKLKMCEDGVLWNKDA